MFFEWEIRAIISGNLGVVVEGLSGEALKVAVTFGFAKLKEDAIRKLIESPTSSTSAETRDRFNYGVLRVEKSAGRSMSHFRC